MGFSKLELAVLDALADELRDQLPDLPGQIAEARPGVRRNTGAGFFSEIIVDRNRPPPDTPLTGRFGTIHGDVPGLIEPMAFQIEVAGGRLTALHGSTYDERTDTIDFTTAPVTGLFRIDADGQSIAMTPRVSMADSPLRDLQKSDEPTPSGLAQPTVWDGGSPHVARSRQVMEAEGMTPSPAAQAVLDALFGQRNDATPDTPAVTNEELTSLVIAAVVLIAVIGLFAVVFLNVPLFFVLIMGGYLASALIRPKGRAALRKAVDLYRAVRSSNGR